MVRVSRFKLPEETLNKLLDLFFEVVGKKNSKIAFNETVIDLLSPIERLMVAKRIAIMYLILKDIDHRTICFALKVSMATVSKYRIIMERSNGIVPTLRQMIKHDQMKLMLEELYSLLFPPGKSGVDWKVAWERKRKIERLKQQGI